MITAGRETSSASIRGLLALHGLEAASQEHVDAIVESIRRIDISKATSAPALTSRQRARALAGINAMCRHAAVPPRRASATSAAREKVLSELDSLAAIIKLAAASGTNATAAVERLRQNRQTLEDLQDLRSAVEAVRFGGGGAGPANAPYLPLLRSAVIVWEACGRPERYSFDQHQDPAVLHGPLPAFVRDLMNLAGAPMPSDAALHRHLRRLKNL